MEKKKRPVVTPLRQQKLKAWKLGGTPLTFIGLYFMVGSVFVSVGTVFLQLSRDLVWYREQYDGAGTPESRSNCRIEEADEGRVCEVTIRVKEKLRKPTPG